MVFISINIDTYVNKIKNGHFLNQSLQFRHLCKFNCLMRHFVIDLIHTYGIKDLHNKKYKYLG